MLKNKVMRPAIAMLELIFAIVIMGIILMSAPQLISTAAKSGYVAIQQEAINEAASQVNMIMGYHWDESATDERYIDPILRVSSTATGLVEAVPTGRRIGTPQESYRSFVRSDGNSTLSASTTLGEDSVGEIKDDMDDFAGTSNIVLIPESTLVANYVETTININTAISYSTDNVNYNQSIIAYNPFIASAVGDTTNIKSIAVTVTEAATTPQELDKEITLRAFSCNIGGYQIEERNF